MAPDGRLTQTTATVRDKQSRRRSSNLQFGPNGTCMRGPRWMTGVESGVRGHTGSSAGDRTCRNEPALLDRQVPLAVRSAVNRSAAQAVAGYSALTHERVLHVIEDL